jgi:Asp-tRNA(Asn)/Glu-tRNA(Gln) amidotransferase B subunit
MQSIQPLLPSLTIALCTRLSRGLAAVTCSHTCTTTHALGGDWMGHVDASACQCLCQGVSFPFGNRVEVKNLNSVRSIARAVEHEVARQIDVMEASGDGAPSATTPYLSRVDQETRTFDPVSGKTVVMRTKEGALDYRFFDDPDLLPLVLSRQYVDSVRATIPELLTDMQERFVAQHGLSLYDASVLMAVLGAPQFFEQVCESPHVSPSGGAPSLPHWSSWLYGIPRACAV